MRDSFHSAFMSHLYRVVPCLAGSLASWARSGVRARVCALSLCVSPEGCFPSSGFDSSCSNDLCPCPSPDPSPVSPGSALPGPSRRPLAWPAGAEACGTAARPRLCHYGPPGARRGPCRTRGPAALAEGAAGRCCHLPSSVSSCREALRAPRRVSVPGWRTGTPRAESRREPSSAEHRLGTRNIKRVSEQIVSNN